MFKAKVIKSSKRDFECQTLDDPKTIVMATALGNLLKGEDSIVVGDEVMIDDKKIVEVLPRRSEIYRLLIREKKKKVTAANCDFMVIVNSVSRPEFKRGIVDRFLVRAHQWQIRPIVVFNKMDEYSEDMFDLQFEVDRLKHLGVECFEMSAKSGGSYQTRFMSNGFEELRKILLHRTAIFLGQSGVGKSKTISLLTDGKIELASKVVGKAGKGQHTTTWSEIIQCEHFDLIDSPGIRSFGVDDLLEEELPELFPDLESIMTGCKFTNCEHLAESKGCAFNKFYQGHERQDRLILSRLESFLKMREEIRQTPDYLKK